MAENKDLKYFIRRMQFSDFEEVLDIFKSEDFWHSLDFNEIMIKLDPNGFLVAQESETGKIVGICSGVNISPNLAFIGQYIVRREYRRLGIGSALWKAVLQHVGPDKNIALYASPLMADKYRDNFRFIPKRLCLYFSGKVNPELLIESIDGISVVNINENNVQNVIEYDQQICGLDRSHLIKELIKTCESDYTKRVAINRENQVVGYCVVSATNRGKAFVEPLYAENERMAELLLRKCCESLKITQTVGLVYCCWDTNPRAVAIANKLGFSRFKDKAFPIMFTKKSIDCDLNRIFCVNSLFFYPC